MRRWLPGAAATCAAAGLVAALPWLGVNGYGQTLAYYVAYTVALGQAWNLMSGMTGYVSFAHGALAGIGGYAAVMAMNADWPFWPALLAGPAAAVIASLVIGGTSLRLRGTAFTFATLFFQVLVLLLVRKLPATGGPGGLSLQDILPVQLPQALMAGLAGLGTVLMLAVRSSRLGVRLLAVKGDETAASALGIAANRLKLLIFCISAALAGMAGAVHAAYTGSLYPDVVFSVDTSLTALAVPMIGGVATAFGPVAGALLYVGLGEALQIIAPAAHLVVVGSVLLLVILFAPRGLLPFLVRAVRRERAPVLAEVASK